MHTSGGVARIHLGTSGYVYPHWRGVLYPEGLPASQWLSQYACVFATVELNNTFYRLPTEHAVDGWREGTPAGFVFSVKGSRYLTHVRRLKDAAQGLRRFFELVNGLGPKLAVVLWQLPPNMKADLPRLERFLELLPRHVRHTVEFRHEDWYRDETADLLDRYGVAFCEHDHLGVQPPRPTGGFRYLRFHGGGTSSGRYGRERLAPVAIDLARWRRSGKDAFAYFNNDLGGYAVQDAVELSELLGAALPFELEEPAGLS